MIHSKRLLYDNCEKNSLKKASSVNMETLWALNMIASYCESLMRQDVHISVYSDIEYPEALPTCKKVQPQEHKDNAEELHRMEKDSPRRRYR